MVQVPTPPGDGSLLLGARSGRALAADHLSLGLAGELAAVVHQEAARAGELVRLARQHAYGELLAGEIRPRKLERLGEVLLVDVHAAGLRLGASGLQLLERVLVEVLVNAWAVVVGSHCVLPSSVGALGNA